VSETFKSAFLAPVAAVMGAGFGALIAVETFYAPAASGDDGSGAGLKVVGTVLILGLLVFCVRMARARVEADDYGIQIHNLARRHRLAWADIQRFTLGPQLGTMVCVVELRDGRSLRAIGIQTLNPFFFSKSGSAQEMIQALNERLEPGTRG
jgi:hypothetical protein